MNDNEFIMLKNVRVSYPHLFTKPIINGDEGKHGATLLLDKLDHSAAIEKIEDGIAELIKTRLKGRKLPSDKVCLRDGDDSAREEYANHMYVSANSNKAPLVIDNTGQNTVKDEAECAIYAGCRVNAKIRLWAQDNNYGKRVNAELLAIQFAADDEPLSGTHVSVSEAMDGFDEAV